jgi:hypothetical protein
VGGVVFVFCCGFFFAVSLAMIRSICLRMMSCSLSTTSSSSSYSVSGSLLAGSFPFFDFFGAAFCIVRWFLLGSGVSVRLVLVAVLVSTSVLFLIYAISTCISITACTNFVGLIVSGSRSVTFYSLISSAAI